MWVELSFIDSFLVIIYSHPLTYSKSTVHPTANNFIKIGSRYRPKSLVFFFIKPFKGYGHNSKFLVIEEILYIAFYRIVICTEKISEWMFKSINKEVTTAYTRMIKYLCLNILTNETHLFGVILEITCQSPDSVLWVVALTLQHSAMDVVCIVTSQLPYSILILIQHKWVIAHYFLLSLII